MWRALGTYVLPGLVIQAVLVGGGYATGRELVEFFLALGPASALLGMAVTAILFSVGAMISFELARRFRTYDYGSFTALFLGRLKGLFEIGYLLGLMLVLSVVSAAAGELITSIIAIPRVVAEILFTALVAAVVFFGSRFVERVISVWSVVFYGVYASLLVITLARFGAILPTILLSEPVHPALAVWSGVTYTAYNIPLLPVLIFVARHFTRQREAVVAGALTGPLVLLPGLAFLLTLTAFYPDILSATLPIQEVLDRLGYPPLTCTVRLVILGALVKTGAGLLHGLNERLSRSAHSQGRVLPKSARALVALLSINVSIFLATHVGLVDLIGKGYRYSAVYYLLVLVLPLLTFGVWRLVESSYSRI